MNLLFPSAHSLAWACVLSCSASGAWAVGTQTGWCIGVGNKHTTSACTAGTPQVVTPTVTVPTVNQGPTGQTGSVNGPTPLSVTVPVLPPVTAIQIQQPELPQTETTNPQLLLQQVQRPRPLPVLRPPSVGVGTTPGSAQGGSAVLSPQPQVPAVTVNPPQPLATVQAPVSNQLVPMLQPPQPVVVPPQVVQVPQPPGQGGTVVLSPQPQVPVVTVNPPQPLATVQAPVSNQLVPMLQPPQPVVVPPQVVQVPQPTGQGGTVVLSPQPQLPVVTVTPPQPPMLGPQAVTTQLVPVIPPRPPVTQVPMPGWIVGGDIGRPQPQKPPITTPHGARPPTGGQSKPDAQRPPQVGITTPWSPQQGPGTQTDFKPDSGGLTWVVRLPGRQLPHALPTRLDVAHGEAPVHCLASGFGWRKQAREDGGWELVGFHPHLRTTDILVRDIPANRHAHAGCVLEVVRRHAEGL